MIKVISISDTVHASDDSPIELSSQSDPATNDPEFLNRMCSSLLTAAKHKRFRAFPEKYCREYGLSLAQIHAVTDLDVFRLIELGCTVPNMDRLTSIYGLDVHDLCLEQTGKSLVDIRNLVSSTG